MPQVVDAYQASYGVHDPTFAVTQLAQTSMRSEIGKMTLDRTFEAKGFILGPRHRELRAWAKRSGLCLGTGFGIGSSSGCRISRRLDFSKRLSALVLAALSSIIGLNILIARKPDGAAALGVRCGTLDR